MRLALFQHNARRLFVGNSAGGESAYWTVLARVLALACLLLLGQVIWLCYRKAYAIDEFFYVHEAWDASRSFDAFVESFLQLGYIGGPILWLPAVLAGGNEPENMLYLRLLMLPVFLVTIVGVVSTVAGTTAETNQERRSVVVLTAIFFMLGTRELVWYGLEVRPDGVAIAATSAALGLLCWERLSDRLAAILAGALVFYACLTSVKAVVYCAPFGIAFVADLLASRGQKPALLRAPLAFAGVIFAGAALILLVLVALGQLETFWTGYVGRFVQIQRTYPALPIEHFLGPFLMANLILSGLAAVGAVGTLNAAVARFRRERILDRRWLLLGFLVFAILSFVLQKAPFVYSLIPVAVAFAIFAAHSVAVLSGLAVFSNAARSKRALTLLIVALAVMTVTSQYRLTIPVDNRRQIEVQREIGALTDPEDTVYDMAGAYVYRPQAHRFSFVARGHYARFKDSLHEEVVPALIDNETILFVYDYRFHHYWRDLPLGRFILEHYQRYNNDLFVWGRKWPITDEPISDEFRAIKSGRYFVHPENGADLGELTVAGQVVRGRFVDLERGVHKLEYKRGSFEGSHLYLIWLPRDGVPFDPEKTAPPWALARDVLP